MIISLANSIIHLASNTCLSVMIQLKDKNSCNHNLQVQSGSKKKLLSNEVQYTVFIICFFADILFVCFSFYCASKQGNVIGLVSVYIYMCVQKKFVIERTRDLIYLKFVATDFSPKIISAGENSGDSA